MPKGEKAFISLRLPCGKSFYFFAMTAPGVEASRSHPGGTQEATKAPRAPEASWTQKSIHLSAKMQKFL